MFLATRCARITRIIYLLFVTEIIVNLKNIHTYIHILFTCERYLTDRATMNKKGCSTSIQNAYTSFVCRVTLSFVGLLYLGGL